MAGVRIWFHLEPAEEGRVVWWAESPDVDGVFVSGDSLAETRLVAEQIVRDVLKERGEVAPSFEYQFLDDPPAESSLSPSDWEQLTAVAS